MAFPLVLLYRGAKDAGKNTPGFGRDAVLPLTSRCEWERSSGVRRTVCAASRSRPERCPNCDSGKGTSIPGVAGSPARGEDGPTSPPTRGRHPAGRWGNRRTSLIADTALPQVKTPGGRAGLRGRGHGGRQAEPRHIGDGGVRRDSPSVPGRLRPAETVGDEPRELFGQGTVEAIRSSTRIPHVGVPEDVGARRAGSAAPTVVPTCAATCARNPIRPLRRNIDAVDAQGASKASVCEADGRVRGDNA